MRYLINIVRFSAFLFLFLALTFINTVKAMDGTFSGYAWSENAGWINLNPPGGGVILDGGTRELKGYAWGENIGWISFNCLNTSSCGAADFKGTIDSYFSMGCSCPLAYSGSGSCPTCPLVDSIPPIISSVAVSGIAPDSATVTWKTNENADSIVEFGKDTAYSFIAGNPADISSPVSDHRLILANLDSDTSYHLKIISRDAAGNISRSDDLTFKTSVSADAGKDKDKLRQAEEIIRELSAQRIATDKIIKEMIGRVSVKPIIVAEETVVKNLTSDSANIFWKTDKEASSLISFKAADNPKSQWREMGVTSDYVTDHLITLNGLTPGTRYQYQAKSIDILGNIAMSKISDFTTKPAAVISEVAVSDITLTGATISWKTSVPTISEMDYGLDTGYKFNYVSKSGDLVTYHEIKLSNLDSGVEYHFRVKGFDDNGSSIVSDDYVFTTYAKPSILNYKVDNVKDNFVEIGWTSNIDIDSVVSYTNVKTSENRTQGDTKLVKNHNLTVTDIEPGTDYVFRAEGTDVFGNKAKSPDIKIRTLEDKIPPAIVSVRTYATLIQNKDQAQLVVVWKTDEPATSQVFLYNIADKSHPMQTSSFDSNLTTRHTVVFVDLTPGSAFRLNIESKDKSGNRAVSDDFSVLAPSIRKSIIQMILEIFDKIFGWMRNIKL